MSLRPPWNRGRGGPRLRHRFPSGTRHRATGSADMASKTPPPDPAKPMSPRSVDGAVAVKDPPEAQMDLTADAAEISGLRLIDAADRARRRVEDPKVGK